MATIEEIRENKKMAEAEYGEAKKKLEVWEEGKYQGKKLNELEDNLEEEKSNEAVRKSLESRRNRLLEDKKKLEEKEGYWRGQVEEWGKALREFGGGEGNKQIA